MTTPPPADAPKDAQWIVTREDGPEFDYGHAFAVRCGAQVIYCADEPRANAYRDALNGVSRVPPPADAPKCGCAATGFRYCHAGELCKNEPPCPCCDPPPVADGGIEGVNYWTPELEQEAQALYRAAYNFEAKWEREPSPVQMLWLEVARHTRTRSLLASAHQREAELRAELVEAQEENQRWREAEERDSGVVNAARNEVARLREALLKLQWLPNDTGNGEPASCPACNHYTTAPGHAPDCFLNAALLGGPSV